jgi:Tfp pilus assembly protein PilN
MIIGSIVFLMTSVQSRNTEIKRQKELLVRKKKELADLDELRVTRSKLQTDIARYANAASVYDSIAPGSDRWSRVLHYLANSVDDLNSLWLYKIQKDDQNPSVLRISGRSIYRTRISRLASLFERATLKQVRTTAIRDKIVYEFDLIVEQVDKGDGPPTKPR